MSCPSSPAWSLSPGSRDEDGDGAPHGASPVLGSCTRTPKCPPFCLKHVCFPRTPFPVLAHQDSPGPGTGVRKSRDPVLPPGRNPQLGGSSCALEGPLPLSLGCRASGGSQSIPVRVLSSPGLATVSPWQRALPAAEASLARHFQRRICIPSLCLLLGAGSRPGQASISKQPLFYW